MATEMMVSQLDELERRAVERFVVVIPSQVQKEYNRNKFSVAEEFARELKKVAEAVDKYYRDFCSAVSAGIPRLTGDYYRNHVLGAYVSRIDKLVNQDALIYEERDLDHVIASKRACERRAPSLVAGKSNADCVIIESYLALIKAARGHGLKNNAYFTTLNTKDFSDPGDLLQPHPDLKDDFAQSGVIFKSDLNEFIRLGVYDAKASVEPAPGK